MICQRPHQEYQADDRWPSCLGGGCHETLDRQQTTHVFLCQRRATKISRVTRWDSKELRMVGCVSIAESHEHTAGEVSHLHAVPLTDHMVGPKAGQHEKKKCWLAPLLAMLSDLNTAAFEICCRSWSPDHPQRTETARLCTEWKTSLCLHHTTKHHRALSARGGQRFCRPWFPSNTPNPAVGLKPTEHERTCRHRGWKRKCIRPHLKLRTDNWLT